MWRLAVPLVLAGCFYQYVYVPGAKDTGSSGPAQQVSLDVIEVVASEQPGRPYKQLGIVHAPGSMERGDAVAVLKQKALALGGDALLNVRKRGSGSKPGGASAGGANAPWDAEVIAWTDRHVNSVAPPPRPRGA
jgi:hypothetical protein